MTIPRETATHDLTVWAIL